MKKTHCVQPCGKKYSMDNRADSAGLEYKTQSQSQATINKIRIRNNNICEDERRQITTIRRH